jgi:formate-dependent nitrite reductase membrane component NrfD
VYSLFIVWYLFLAGMGSGAYVLAAIFGFAGGRSRAKGLREYREITRGGFYLGPLLVMFGAVFLIFDLGSPEKAYRLFLSTRFTYLTFGSWVVLVFCLLAAALALLRSTDRVRLPRPVFKTLELIAATCALGIMGYTGLFLSSMPSIPFLNSPLIVVLLIVSSLATGSALIALYGFFNQQRKSMFFGSRIIVRIDLVLIFIEILILAALIVASCFGGDLSAASVGVLLAGAGAPAFWFGVVLLGLAVPCVVGMLGRQSSHMVNQAISSTAVLLGGLALRYALITAGLHVADTPVLLLSG